MCFKKIKDFFNPPLADILMQDESIYIDEEYFKKGLKGKYLLSARLTKEKVGTMQRQIDKKIYDLWDNDLYRYLQKRVGGVIEKISLLNNLFQILKKMGLVKKALFFVNTAPI